MNAFWHRQRLNRVSTSILLAIVVALAVGYTIDTENKGLLRRGDFPGFYAPAVILSRGLEENLYDQKLQRNIENEFWPSKGAYYSFAYPPFVALALKPLAAFTPRSAQLIFIAFHIACFLIALHLLSRLNPLLRQGYLFTLTGCLCFAPFFYAIFGAQNTALSMLLYTAAFIALKKQSGSGSFTSGILLGLWLFKPQYAAFGLLFLFGTKNLLGLVGFGVSATLLYILGAVVSGVSWPLEWLQTVTAFSSLNFIYNQQENVSVLGFFKALDLKFGSQLFWFLGIFLTAITLAWYFRSLLRAPKSANNFMLLGPLTVALSPQTLFYDLGILLVPVLYYFKPLSDRKINQVVCFLALAGILTYFRQSFPVPPLILVTLALYYWINVSSKSS